MVNLLDTIMTSRFSLKGRVLPSLRKRTLKTSTRRGLHLAQIRYDFRNRFDRFVMRLSLTTLLISLAVAAVAARRGTEVPMSSPNSVPPFHPQRSHSLAPWGYPYGWGLDDSAYPAEDPNEVNKMKPVKRGKKSLARVCSRSESVAKMSLFLWELNGTIDHFLYLRDGNHLLYCAWLLTLQR
jgi:hypothetical protein